MKQKPVALKIPVKKGKTEKSNGCDEKKYLLGRERQNEIEASYAKSTSGGKKWL